MFCPAGGAFLFLFFTFRAIPHNSKCRYGERGTADAKPKAQIILDAAKVSAASGGNSEPKQGQRSQSARGFYSRSTMRVPQSDIIEHFGNADAVPQPPERCLSRKAGIVRCCLSIFAGHCDSITTSFALSSKKHRLIFSHYYKSSKSSETAFASREWQSRIFTKNSPLQTMEYRILCRYTNSIRQFA